MTVTACADVPEAEATAASQLALKLVDDMAAAKSTSWSTSTTKMCETSTPTVATSLVVVLATPVVVVERIKKPVLEVNIGVDFLPGLMVVTVVVMVVKVLLGIVVVVMVLVVVVLVVVVVSLVLLVLEVSVEVDTPASACAVVSGGAVV